MKTTKELHAWEKQATKELVKELDNKEIKWSSYLIKLKNIEVAAEMFHEKITKTLDGKQERDNCMHRA